MLLEFSRRCACAVNSVLLSLLACGMVLAAAGTSALAAGASASDGLAKPQRTRFIIGLDRRADYQVFSLSNPNRVVVELPKVGMALPNMPTNGPVGLVSSFTGGSAGSDKSRVVINVTAPVVVEKAELSKVAGGKHHELSIDILQITDPVPVVLASRAKSLDDAPFEKPSGLGATGIGYLQPPLPRPAESPESRAARSFKPIIVIDPGHGGHDSGAKKNGVIEKNVVLDFSLTLRDKLNATGRYKVLMTRDTDEFISLDGRRAFAEKNGAELFIAVHADYARSSARGATVYSLRDSVAKRLQKTTKRQIAGSIAKDERVHKATSNFADIKGILSDLAEREVTATRERTDMVSRSIVEFMGGSTNLRNDPHKTAAFKVLKTAQFPSVLIELAYVTNVQDAQLLKSKPWREKVSASLVTAVDNYFASQVARLPM